MRSLVILVVVGFLAVAESASLLELAKEEWKLFKITHKKTYHNEHEENLRFEIFRDNKHKIARHNQRFQNGEVTYAVDVNKYADLLPREFAERMNGFNRSTENSSKLRANRVEKGVSFIAPANVKLPESVDWRKQGAVTPIKDQGHCGSCWSFSSTGALEGQHFRATGKLVSLSEQNLVDCSASYGNNGCNGGLMDQAFQYIKDNGGIDTEKTYPYEGIDDKCRYKAKNSGATDKGFVDIPTGDEAKLAAALATIGPVSVAIDASQESFQFYSKGVYFDENCSSEQLDHGVLAVGFGTDAATGQDYWLVKNSWGTTWGDQGYIKMARNKENHCGIATAASYPLV